MVHGYHLIWSTYGFRLPNDPRGSKSKKVYAELLKSFGGARQEVAKVAVTPNDLHLWRTQTELRLKYPPVTLQPKQIEFVSEAIGRFVERSRMTVWACSLLEQHIHMVIGRHRYSIETACNLMKGAASRRLNEMELHPMICFSNNKGKLPSMWTEGQWIHFLDDEDAIDDAMRYVEDNPVKEGKEKQSWWFVERFQGITGGGWSTYN
jgi:REP element-mobilizing transposase RayT